MRYGFLIKRIILSAACMTLLLSGCNGGRDIHELRAEAIEAFDSGDYAGAERLFDEALEAQWGRVSDLQTDILRYRAECELQQGKFDEARTTYEALLNVDSDEEGQGFYEDILEELGSLDALSTMVSDIEAGEYQKAYDLASQYASLEGTAAGRLSWFNKAVCAEYLGNYDEAYALFNEYLKVYPDDADAEKELEFLKTR